MTTANEIIGTDEIEIGSDLFSEEDLKDVRAASMTDVRHETCCRARKLLGPTPVKAGAIPKWLRSRMLVAKRSGSIEAMGTTNWALINGCTTVVSHLTDTSGFLWLDHWGSTNWNFMECFVTEPYGCEHNAFEAFANLLKLDWRLSANSWHYPGSTFRALFYLPRSTQA